MHPVWIWASKGFGKYPSFDVITAWECQAFPPGGILMPARVVLCRGYWTALDGTDDNFRLDQSLFLHIPILSSCSTKATQPLLPACLMFEHHLWHFPSINWTTVLVHCAYFEGNIWDHSWQENEDWARFHILHVTYEDSFVWACVTPCMQLDVGFTKFWWWAVFILDSTSAGNYCNDICFFLLTLQPAKDRYLYCGLNMEFRSRYFLQLVYTTILLGIPEVFSPCGILLHIIFSTSTKDLWS